jgi:hypothetical protein
MSPDLNSLPTNPMPHSPSPSSHTLAATATLNATIHTEDHRPQSLSTSTPLHLSASRQRRRSSVRLNLSLNDPGVPGPGEMLRAESERGVSLGELHQAMEWEGEGRVVSSPFLFVFSGRERVVLI